MAPKNSWSHYYAASLFFMQQRSDLALQAARNAVGLDPANAKAQNLSAPASPAWVRRDEARTAFLASLKADPRDPGTYSNLATLEMQAGNRALAMPLFRRSPDDRSRSKPRATAWLPRAAAASFIQFAEV